MTLPLDSLVIFRGNAGLSVTVSSNSFADGIKELDSVVDSLGSYYRREDPNASISYRALTHRDARLYDVANGTGHKIGTVSITPKGVNTRIDRREQDDFPIADPTRYRETYWIFFNPKDRSETREHREGYAIFADPTGRKTRRNQ